MKDNFPDHKFTFLFDKHEERQFITPEDVLKGSNLINDFIHYRVKENSRVFNFFEYFKLFLKLFWGKYESLIYLSPSERLPSQVKRDLGFFKAAGIKNVIAHQGLRDMASDNDISPLPTLEKESELLITRLKKAGLKVPEPDQGRFDLNLTNTEINISKAWLKKKRIKYSGGYIALGIGSKMETKKWPIENYIYIVENLIKEFDVCPIIFGGKEDINLAKYATKEWGIGHVAAGELRIRESVALMSLCKFYLGNDTGTMHLAASSGIKCISIFSSRDHPGAWYPYGKGHLEFRSSVPCEGCMLHHCIENELKCLKSIDKEEVLEASSLLMSNYKNKIPALIAR